MLSRVADSVYWMSRYVERAENVARFVEVNEHLMLDLPPELPPQWGALVEITGDIDAFHQRYRVADQESVCRFLTFDESNPNSILSSLRAARNNARSVREILSSAVWAEINEAYLYAEQRARDGTGPLHEFLRRIIHFSHGMEGTTDATVSHSEAWHFCRLGRLLERADKTTRIVDIRYFMHLPTPEDGGGPTDDLHWTAVLQSASALEMYRQRHGMVQLDRTVEFLLLDGEFPRSVRNCLKRAAGSLHAITGTPLGSFRNEAERQLGRLAGELDYTAIGEIVDEGLHDFLDTLQLRLNGVGNALNDAFFSPHLPPRAKRSRSLTE